MNTKTLLTTGAVCLIAASGAIFAWQTFGRALTQDSAADVVIARFPALAEYRTVSLPPSAIEGKQVHGGWQLAFVQRGSGVPGILTAHCYLVTDDRRVVEAGNYTRPGDAYANTVDPANCQALDEQMPQIAVMPYGTHVLNVGEYARFKDVALRPVAIVEDSRCPIDVQCIQAGTVRVSLEISSNAGTSTSVVSLGKEFTTEGVRITLAAADPAKQSKAPITIADYRLTFSVTAQSAPSAPVTTGKCYIGGCSSQLCTDKPDAISTCEYTASYACYKTARCERQASGACGWTNTPELAACLANPE